MKYTENEIVKYEGEVGTLIKNVGGTGFRFRPSTNTGSYIIEQLKEVDPKFIEESTKDDILYHITLKDEWLGNIVEVVDVYPLNIQIAKIAIENKKDNSVEYLYTLWVNGKPTNSSYDNYERCVVAGLAYKNGDINAAKYASKLLGI